MKNSDQLFDAQFEQDLSKATGLDDATVADLTRSFEPIGQRFLRIIETTPTNFSIGPSITPKVRLDWLRNDLQPSLTELVATLREPAKLSGKPDTLPSELTEAELAELARLLEKLDRYADELGDCLEDRIADKSTINAEIRFELVSELAVACDEAGITVARDHHTGKNDVSLAPIIIRKACKVICGDLISVDPHLRDYIKLRAKKSAKA
ncbi:hypothetical protein [Pseudoblastomonas halimionae]|uniref:Uncharacterized protein n=1 Tax=Alteriqipengyuania halimionae TaxID=1926630 RepID=A0A6I4U176_9SPHN|nr:hypothetical protein [Alteriqipengyuania halimionae]MXP09638.1 hypothetical protein [Alteriqipengyuania halimionae]